MKHAEQNTDGGRLDLVVAEDDPSIAAVVTRMLTRRGYTVRACVDGAEALAQIRERRPDIILTDYQMPNLDGVELARTLAESPETRDIPILMLTARGHRVPEDLIDATGVARIVAKPFSGREVGRILDELEYQIHGEAA